MAQFDNKGPPPPLGTRRKTILPPRALHDPTSEFAIVLYDPTVDIIPTIEEPKENDKEKELEENKENIEERPAKRRKNP